MTGPKKAEKLSFTAQIAFIRMRIQTAQRQLSKLMGAHPAWAVDLLPALELGQELLDLLEKIRKENQSG
ncbi:MAG: hypothetical protein IKO35_05255 [Elusimicrobiaceae bacterium]|nr:hypothetical protein [Elusimicrobiaceae bacterium]